MVVKRMDTIRIDYIRELDVLEIKGGQMVWMF